MNFSIRGCGSVGDRDSGFDTQTHGMYYTHDHTVIGVWCVQSVVQL